MQSSWKFAGGKNKLCDSVCLEYINHCTKEEKDCICRMFRGLDYFDLIVASDLAQMRINQPRNKEGWTNESANCTLYDEFALNHVRYIQMGCTSTISIFVQNLYYEVCIFNSDIW